MELARRGPGDSQPFVLFLGSGSKSFFGSMFSSKQELAPSQQVNSMDLSENDGSLGPQASPSTRSVQSEGTDASEAIEEGPLAP